MKPKKRPKKAREQQYDWVQYGVEIPISDKNKKEYLAWEAWWMKKMADELKKSLFREVVLKRGKKR